MLKPTIQLTGILQSDVGFKQTKTRKNEGYFTLLNGEDQYLVLAFDDEGDNLAYRRLETLKLKKGSLVQIVGQLAFKKQFAIPDQVWKSMYPNQDNQSRTYFPMIKLSMIDYAIPLDYVNPYKKNDDEKDEGESPSKNEIIQDGTPATPSVNGMTIVPFKPIGDFSEFEKTGGGN